MAPKYSNRLLVRTLLFALPLLLLSAHDCFAQWKFDWQTRLDRDGNPPGILQTTPFPITESSVSYSIKNDENPLGKTYALGTRYYVDGARPNDSGDGLSLATAKKTIASALSVAGNGNRTVIVRGAHDTFNGVYAEGNLSFSAHSGTSDTARFMLVGYGQERPTLEGTGLGNVQAIYGTQPSYVTIQRLKVQNYQERGILFNLNNANVVGINLIDLWVYNCGANNLNDGNIHMYAADNVYSINSTWVFHIASEHTFRKGIKICDHTHDTLIEWSYFNECGYWPGMSTLPDPNQHPYGIDCAADSATQHNLRTIIRYNIVGKALLGNEIRYPEDISIHHNEFYDSVKKDYWPAHGGTYSQAAALHVRWMLGKGTIYSNIFRDNTDTTFPYLLTLVAAPGGSTGEYSVYNNLFYGPSGSPKAAPYVWVYGYGGETDTRRVDFFNNSFYGNTSLSQPLLSIANPSSGVGNVFKVVNNIFYQTGAGSCVDFGPATSPYLVMNNNRYYYPSGSRGTALGTGETDGNPMWTSVPQGSYQANYCSLTSALVGANLSGVFDVDFAGNSRSGWDMGALELVSGSSGATPEKPMHLRIKSTAP